MANSEQLEHKMADLGYSLSFDRESSDRIDSRCSLSFNQEVSTRG